MEDISHFFSPIQINDINPSQEVRPAQQEDTLGTSIIKFLQEKQFPDLKGIHLAIIGMEEDRRAVNNEGCGLAANAVRPYLYNLFKGKYKPKIADLGNIKAGNTVKDSYFALTSACHELIKNKIIPVVIGGGQDITFPLYKAFNKIEATINVVDIDSKFDIGGPDSEFNSSAYVGKIILHQPNILFNYSNIGYQTHFVPQKEIDLFHKLYFDSYRLGKVRGEMEEVEPIVRNADLLSFDISSIRMSDAPGNGNASPNGFYGEEACQITRYAGLSDKLSAIGFFEINPTKDERGQTVHLVAQMIWYFIEGYYQRYEDFPFRKKSDYLKYRVSIKEHQNEIVFYKSKRSDRWWMEVPYPTQKKLKFERHCLVPCSYNDYEAATKEEVPDRWWQSYQKLT